MSLARPASAPTLALLGLLDQKLEEATFDRLLGLPGLRLPPGVWEQALLGPARAFLARPGKAFRPTLVEAAFEMAGGSGSAPREAGAIVELLHAGSLIVDDIEDGSTERRGGPALHETVGIPLALNTGNWLYFLPMLLVEHLGLPVDRALGVHRRMARTLVRCHHGQALDLSVRVGQLPQGDVGAVVEATTRLKTGSLLELAAFLGATAAGADAARVEALARFGEQLGVGLQMLDDLSSLESPDRAAKAHEDLGHERPTWPWAWLAEVLDQVSFARLQRLARRVGAREDHPELLAESVRQALGPSGRVRVRAYVDAVFTEAREKLGAPPALESMRAEVARLEAAYG